MTERKRYDVVVKREAGWWIIQVPELDDRVTQARRLNEVERNVRELVAVWLDVPMDSFDVDVSVELPSAVERSLRSGRRLQSEARKSQEAAAAEVRAAATALVQEWGLSLSDTARALGISHQRVSQLIGHRQKAS